MRIKRNIRLKWQKAKPRNPQVLPTMQIALMSPSLMPKIMLKLSANFAQKSFIYTLDQSISTLKNSIRSGGIIVFTSGVDSEMYPYKSITLMS